MPKENDTDFFKGKSTLTDKYRHIPVMLDEVITHLSPQSGEVYLDCTLGGAGHACEVAKKIGETGTLIGIDQDESARSAATLKLDSLSESEKPKLYLEAANFSEIDDVLLNIPVPYIDLALFDLGVSSPQFDLAERGFSYRYDSPLDMRMNQGGCDLTAQTILNEWSCEEIERILRVYGEEKFSRKIAYTIAKRREKSRIETSGELVDIIKQSIPASARRSGGHPAKKTFQALRIAVNDELSALERGLDSAVRWMRCGGRIAVISYHSLEDRIVKEKFRSLENRCTCSADLPVCVCGMRPILKTKPRGAILPSEHEVEENPRSRSAKLRVAEKIED